MSGGLPGIRIWPVVTCLIDRLPHRHGYHGGIRECRCDSDMTYIVGLTPCHEPRSIGPAVDAAEPPKEASKELK